MLAKKMQRIFALVTLLALLLFAANLYRSYHYNHSDIEPGLRQSLEHKANQMRRILAQRYGITAPIAFVISPKLPARLYGMTQLGNDGRITVFINKKALRESKAYVLDDVIAHEFAHAAQFALGKISNTNGGHDAQWQGICHTLQGKHCERYVNTHDVVMGKLPF